MQIILSREEVYEHKKIMDTVDSNSVKDTMKSLKGNKIVDCNVGTHATNITIDSRYMAEYLRTYGKYLNLIIPQGKALFETIKMFQEESIQVALKYATDNKDSEDKQQEYEEDLW